MNPKSKLNLVVSVLILFVGFLISTDSYAQQLVGQKVMEIPVQYFNPTHEKLLQYSVSTEYRPATVWIVYSDRNGNKTHDKPRTGKDIKTVGFLDKFFVLEETENEIHIVSDKNIKSGILSVDAEDFGWVEKSKMLLWTQCLVNNPISKITRKAMVLNTLEALEKDINDVLPANMEDQQIKFYQDPDLLFESKERSNLFQIFFVFKITENAVLLCKRDNFDDDYKGEMIGWTEKARVTFWNSRVAVEPNFDKIEAQARRDLGLKSVIFENENKAKRYADGSNGLKVLWDEDPYENRFPGEIRRFPLIDDLIYKDANILKVGVMGSPFTQSGKKINEDDNAAAQKSYNDRRESRKNINVVFVIDGTKSMQPYFTAISNSIVESMEALGNIYSNLDNTIRFAAVVYRDYAEEEVGRLTEVISLTTDYRAIFNWLNKIEAKDIKDKDTPEAMFYGMKTALRQTGWSESAAFETNVMIVVGDAGNHLSDDRVSSQEILRLLEDKNCNLLAFQTHHQEHSSYDDFIEQFKNLILPLAVNKYNETLEISSKLNLGYKPPKLMAFPNLIKVENASIVGTIKYASLNESIESTDLKDEIIEVVTTANVITNDLKVAGDMLFMDGVDYETAINSKNANSKDYSKYSFDLGPAFLQIIQSMNISEDKLNALSEANYQLYTEGFTPYKVNEQILWDKVLLLNITELSSLVEDMKRLYSSTSTSSQRRDMKDVWINLLRKHEGELTYEEINSKTMEEVQKTVFGLPGQSDILKNVKLGDIEDVSRFPDDKFQEYVRRLKMKQELLNKIANDDTYQYMFKAFGIKYYWISERLLP